MLIKEHEYSYEAANNIWLGANDTYWTEKQIVQGLSDKNICQFVR